MIASFVNFSVNLSIGFVLSPFIVKHVGTEAFGFAGLANNMVNYAAILTVALNSVAGRFITVAYHRGEKATADRYFSSTLVANAVLVLAMTVVSMPLIINLEHVINISPHLIIDVKVLFTFVFLNFAIGTITTVLTVATFVKNKLYLQSIANIAYSLTRVATLVVCFAILPPRVFYVGLALCLGTIALSVLSFLYTKKLLPEIRFQRTAVSWKGTKQMLSSGIWNSVIKLQQILMDGLSLLIANIAVSPVLMGVLSIAQVVPMALSGLTTTVSALFFPEQTRYFAQNNKEQMLKSVKMGMRISGFFTNIVFVVLIVVGEDFIRIWQPTQNARLVYHLMILTMSGFFLFGVAVTLQNIPTIVNRLKRYSIAWLICGVVSLLLTLILIKVTNWGVYVIAAVPQLVCIVANLTVVPICASNYLHVARRTFYPVYAQYVVATLVSCAVSFMLRDMFHLAAGSWLHLFILCVLFGSVTAVINLFMLLGSHERVVLLQMMKQKLHL